MVIQAYRPCPLCFNKNVVLIYETNLVVSDNLPLDPNCKVVVCQDCGFAYSDTRSNAEDFDRYYSSFSKYEDAHTSTGSGSDPVDAMRLKGTADTIANVMPDRSIRVLDIGCANGGLLEALAQLGYSNLTGIDPSPKCAAIVDGKSGLKGYEGTVTNWPVEIGRFDLVILTGVLEHLLEPEQLITALNRLLDKNGVVFIAVPDARRYNLIAPFQDFSLEHINHFSLEILSNWFVSRGFVIVDQAERIEPMPPNFTCAVIHGFYRKGEVCNSVKLFEDLSRYITGSNELLTSIRIRLEAGLRHRGTVIIWGVGQLSLKLLSEPALKGKTIVAFVDGNPINHGKYIQGVKVLSPDELQGMDDPILVSTTIAHKEIRDIIQNRLGLSNNIILLAD